MAVTSLVLGIVGLVFSFIPFVNIVGIILGIIGLIFGLIGIFKSRRTMSIIGSVLSLLAIILSIVISSAFAKSVDDAINNASTSGATSSDAASGSDTIHVTYEIDSDATSVSATYATLNGGSVGQAQDNGVAPPWKKDLDIQQSLFKSFILTGQMSPAALGKSGGKDGTTITCKITVDGKVVATQTSTGQYALVTCNSNG